MSKFVQVFRSGKLAQTTCLFEVYRNAIQPRQIRQCLGKLVDVQENQWKQATKESKNLDESQLAKLWIITPTISEAILSKFKADSSPNWESGIYFLGEGLFTGIVTVHQLPVNQDTLWLRILGKGKVQLRAIEELKNSPLNYPYRESILELIYSLLDKLEANRQKGNKIEKQEEELIMTLRTAFRDKLAQEKQQGLQQGLQQEAFLLINRQLKRKIGDLPSNLLTRIENLSLETLENLGEALLDFNSISDLTNWLEASSNNK